MGRFISNFQTTAELAAFSATTNFSKPHVSLTKDNLVVHYFADVPDYRWVDDGFTCVGFDKYTQKKQQMSYHGSEWTDTGVVSAVTLVEHNSEYCGYVEPQHRTRSGETYCDGYDMCVDVYSEISYDEGSTWEITATTKTLVKHNSKDCGYVPVLVCTYDVDNIESPTKLFFTASGSGSGSGKDVPFASMKIDGAEEEVAPTYQFEDYGEHTVEFTLKDDSVPNNSFSGCSNLINIVIPDSVTTIGSGAFGDCSGITSVTIGSDVTNIGDGAFVNCSGLTSIVIPDSVTSIGESAFTSCSGLTSCTIGSGVTSIGSSAFTECIGLTDVVIPDNVTSIGSFIFYHCINMTGCTIGSGVTSISSDAFRYCSGLTSVTIPSTVTSIGDNAFYECSGLTSIVMPDSVTSIGSGAFTQCSSLTSIDIPSGVTSIGGYAFSGCRSLTDITIPDSVTRLEDSTFSSCSGLTSVTIGSGVTSIGGYNFNYCTSLTSIISRSNTAPTVYQYTFQYINNGGTLYVPSGSSGYGTWMQNANYYLGLYNWTKVEQ